MSKAFLSVVMITYGQEKYVKKAIEGVFNQDTDFDFELIISNDASPDNSNFIISELLKNVPSQISVNYIRHDSNIGMMPNFIFTLNKAASKYIALCEGDDYWTDPLKLQKQVDFLEANEDYVMCFHNVEEVDVDGNVMNNNIIHSSSSEKTYTQQELAHGNFIHTPSVVFKNNIKEQLPAFFQHCAIGDYPLHMLNAQFGKIKYMPEKMCAYRVGSGVWSKQSEKYRIINTIMTITYLIQYFHNNDLIVNNLQKQIINLLELIKDTDYIHVSSDPNYKNTKLMAEKMYIGNILHLLKLKIVRKLWKAN